MEERRWKMVYSGLAILPVSALIASMPRELTGRNFLQMVQQGWIAGYPPWFHNFWIKPAKCKNQKEKTHLLEFLRAVEASPTT